MGRMLAGSIAAAAFAFVWAGSAGAVSPPPTMFGPLVTVATGQWDGTAWTLQASDQVKHRTVSYCIRMTFANGDPSQGTCRASAFVLYSSPPFFPSGRPRGDLKNPYGMDLFEKTGGCPGLDYVVGPVAATVSRLSVTFLTRMATEPKTINGQTVQVSHSTAGTGVPVSIVAAPTELVPGVAFYVGQVACGTKTKDIFADGHTPVTTTQWPGGTPVAGLDD